MFLLDHIKGFYHLRTIGGHQDKMVQPLKNSYVTVRQWHWIALGSLFDTDIRVISCYSRTVTRPVCLILEELDHFNILSCVEDFFYFIIFYSIYLKMKLVMENTFQVQSKYFSDFWMSKLIWVCQMLKKFRSKSVESGISCPNLHL